MPGVSADRVRGQAGRSVRSVGIGVRIGVESVVQGTVGSSVGKFIWRLSVISIMDDIVGCIEVSFGVLLM